MFADYFQIKMDPSHQAILIIVAPQASSSEKWMAALQTELGETLLRQQLITGTNRLLLDGISQPRIIVKIDSMFRTVVREINLLQTE